MGEPLQTEALKGLCFENQPELLDCIDSLRLQGVSHYEVSLPQIVVCGDQSSGKSSVLEAISGVSFPVKSNLCTRFPTELILRKTEIVSSARVSIVPHQSHGKPGKPSFNSFSGDLKNGFEGLPDLIERAKTEIGVATSGKAFSKDLLRVEVSGPNLPHLTIVDLPGLIHSETKQQSSSDVELVQDVVRDYMKEPRSIILAVVSAKNDYANQVVLKLARAADKKGTRTLGVITKPDTLISDSPSEANFVDLARNKEIEFKLGWHVLKNMDSETGRSSLTERDRKEEEFFSRGVWGKLTRSLLGIKHLRDRLSRVLLKQISGELPSLISEIDLKSNLCRSRLKDLGEPRATVQEQRLYLLHISQSFQSLAKAAAGGTYNDTFFEDPTTKLGYHKRIRAWTQNLNQGFADEITELGHLRKIVKSSRGAVGDRGQMLVKRTEYLDHIQDLMRKTRGRELPGTFNPMIVVDLFYEQSRPWKDITQKHVRKVWHAAKEFLDLTLGHVADAETSKSIWRHIFEPALKHLLNALKEKTEELLTPLQAGHPITYSQDFVQKLQRLRNERAREECEEIIEKFFEIESLDSVRVKPAKDLRPLVDALSKRKELDVERSACSEALDCMHAYYEVALKRFIDDVAVEIVETKLISKLHDIFSPMTVASMFDDKVNAIAGESEDSRVAREELNKQLEVLTKGSETCKRFIHVQDLGR